MPARYSDRGPCIKRGNAVDMDGLGFRRASGARQRARGALVRRGYDFFVFGPASYRQNTLRKINTWRHAICQEVEPFRLVGRLEGWRTCNRSTLAYLYCNCSQPSL